MNSGFHLRAGESATAYCLFVALYVYLGERPGAKLAARRPEASQPPDSRWSLQGCLPRHPLGSVQRRGRGPASCRQPGGVVTRQHEADARMPLVHSSR